LFDLKEDDIATHFDNTRGNKYLPIREKCMIINNIVINMTCPVE